MRDCLSASARMIALACAAAFIIVTVFVLFLFNTERQLLDPESYKQALLERQFYNQLPSVIAGELASSNGQPFGGGDASYFRNLKREDWEIMLSGLMTPEWLRGQTESAIDQVFMYLNSAQPEPRVIVSLAEIKIRLQGEPGMRAFMQMLRAQPACTEQQLLVMAQAAFTGDIENMPLCMPPEDLLVEFRPEIQTILLETAASLPDEVELGSQFSGTQAGSRAGSPTGDPRPAIRLTRTIIRLSPLLPAALLLVVTAFAVRSFRDWLLWWGTPLLLAGLASLGLGLVAGPLISAWIADLFLGWMEFPAGVAALATSIGQDLARGAIRPILIVAGVLALVGLGMAGLGMVLRPNTSL